MKKLFLIILFNSLCFLSYSQNLSLKEIEDILEKSPTERKNEISKKGLKCYKTEIKEDEILLFQCKSKGKKTDEIVITGRITLFSFVRRKGYLKLLMEIRNSGYTLTKTDTENPDNIVYHYKKDKIYVTAENNFNVISFVSPKK